MRTVAETAEKQGAVASDYAAGDPPLAGADEEQRAEDLDDYQRDQQIGDTPHRAWHDGQDAVEISGLFTFLVATQGEILQHSEAKPDYTARDESRGRS